MKDVSKQLAIDACIGEHKPSVYEEDFSYSVMFDERWLAKMALRHPLN